MRVYRDLVAHMETAMFQMRSHTVFRFNTLVKFFHEWRSRTECTIRESIDMNDAMRFRQQTVLFNAWQTWLQKVKRRARRKESIRCAKEHYFLSLTAKYFRIWMSRLRVALAENFRMDEAYNKYLMKLKSQCFAALKSYTEYRKQKREEVAEIVSIIRGKLLLGKKERAWKAWTEYHQSRVQKKVNIARAHMHLRRYLFNQSILQLKRYAVSRINKKALKAIACNHYDKRLRARFLILWKNQMQLALDKQQLLEKADEKFNTHLRKRTIHAFCSYLKHRRKKKEMLQNALEMHRTNSLRQGITRWMDFGLDDTLDDYILIPPELSTGSPPYLSGREEHTLQPSIPDVAPTSFSQTHLVDLTKNLRPSPRRPFDAVTSIIENVKLPSGQTTRKERVMHPQKLRDTEQHPRLSVQFSNNVETMTPDNVMPYANSIPSASNSVHTRRADNGPTMEDFMRDMTILEAKLIALDRRTQQHKENVKHKKLLEDRLSQFYSSIPDEQLPSHVVHLRMQCRQLEDLISEYRQYKRSELRDIQEILESKKSDLLATVKV